MVVQNSAKDDRFADNPLVTGQPNVLFYAGVPLVNPEGFPLGTLCVIDRKPNQLTSSQILSLKALAHQVVAQLELRKKVQELNKTRQELERANEELTRFAHVVAHDLKSPLVNIASLTSLLKSGYSDKLDSFARQSLDFLESRATGLKELVDGILEYYKYSDETITRNTELVDLNQLVRQVVDLLIQPTDFEIRFPDNLPTIITSKTALQQILLNLLNNAIKYNDKAKGIAELSFWEQEDFYLFRISDNGAGIRPEHHQKVFDLFETLGRKDRFDKKGTGIGLATVKKLIDRAGGVITLESKPGEGAIFSFTLRK